MKRFLSGIIACICILPVSAQTRYPVNGIPDERTVFHAFTHVTLWVDYQTVIDSAVFLIRDGKVADYGKNLAVPAGAVVHDCRGMVIYPSFIDPYTQYGLPDVPETERPRVPQLTTTSKGAYSWNQALKPETDASRIFTVQPEAADKFRKAGFGSAFTFVNDGIARGTGAVVSLGDEKPQDALLKEQAAACFSFNKGQSKQDYPTSEMGAIALLRQTCLDADWYRDGGKDQGRNLSLQAWNGLRGIPWIFEAENKWQSIRADKVGDEFGVAFIIRGSGDEYQRIPEIKATGDIYILPLKFQDPLDVTDPYDAVNVSLEELRHWEMAPANPFLVWKAGIKIAFTSSGLKDPADFLEHLRTAVEYGLPQKEALRACTATPAELLGVSGLAGGLHKGMLANFLIASDTLFAKDFILYENWIKGKQYILKRPDDARLTGSYSLNIIPAGTFTLQVTGRGASRKSVIIQGTDTSTASVDYDNNNITIRFEWKKTGIKPSYVLDGYGLDTTATSFRGSGISPQGNPVTWDMRYTGTARPIPLPKDTIQPEIPSWGPPWYPNKAFGFDTLPQAETVLIRNITVWTNEKEGILPGTDVLIRNGKIAEVGHIKDVAGAQVIDGTGKHLTPGIIDEHSHIAISGDVNECSHSVTAEVRIGDVINSDDINIYRQLSGGVTSAQLLHGSCNSIGGQSAIIKLRWGKNPEQLKFEGADGFIKFALGENVKQSNWGDENKIRYPQTRMGVEQVYVDAFTRAHEYQAEWKRYSENPKGKIKPRRDLRLETLVEITSGKRFITCHSYEQGEINMLMHVADSLGFRINTFTHILEGYKVADKMKAHGVGASSFSDWWAYKYEVMEAIPYNGAIMHRMGLIVAYNSDDPEMARRLNQEAAKAVKYGGISEEEALKFVTLNPAKLLHIDNRVGSIVPGKDADVVIWNDNPLSVYAHADVTFVDGVRYFDRQRDVALQHAVETERARLIRKMTEYISKNKGSESHKPAFRPEVIKHCLDDE